MLKRFHTVQSSLATGLVALILTVASGTCVRAQTFEVASVKQGHVEGRRLPGGVVFRKENGRVDFQRISPEALVMSAYPQFEIADIVFPEWVAGSDGYYDIAATAPPGTTNDELTVMLRNLLADRFKLAVHTLNREADVYVLKQSAQGVTLRSVESESPAPRVMALPLSDVWRVFSPGAAPDGSNGSSKMTISTLVRVISPHLSRKMLDQTGLTATYLIDVSFPRDTDPTAEHLGWRDDELFAALRKAYGLTVEKQRKNITTLVIDHMEQTPTPN
jgi:uncharacterized protein (TIGR03435 family)